MEVYEVVKTYQFWFENVHTRVIGRILKSKVGGNMPYQWWISHHYRPSEGAQFYYPSVLSAASAQEAEQLLMQYAGGFETAAEVKQD